jgi:hypothetical protein
VLSNACYEHGAALPAGADAAQPGVWHLYAGAGQRCLADGAGGDGRRLCAGELLHINHTLAGGGNANWMKVGTVLVRVVEGAPPAGARWYGEDDVVVILPHTLNALNYWHSVADHSLPLFWQLRWMLGHRAYLRDRGAPAGAAGPRVLVSPLQTNGDDTFRRIIAAFPHVSLVRPGALVVNIGRGSVVDEAAVLAVLESGHLAGYAADVFEFEDWLLPSRPREIAPALSSHPRTLFTPHLGSAVARVRREIALRAAHNILDALAGRTPRDLLPP